MKKTFKCETDYIELCQLLKLLVPLKSGGEAKIAIKSGLVTVDGQIELRKKCKIKPGQTVVYDELEIDIV